MGIAIEGPELSAVNFDEVLEIFKQKIIIEELCFDLHFLIIKEFCSELPFIFIIKNSDFLGGIPGPPPVYEALIWMYRCFGGGEGRGCAQEAKYPLPHH